MHALDAGTYPVGVLGRPAVQSPADVNGISRPDVALAFSHVSKTYPDGTRALDDISIQVRPGEMVSIVGPSGCGKSTLLRLASRLTAPTAGEIRIGDGN